MYCSPTFKLFSNENSHICQFLFKQELVNLCLLTQLKTDKYTSHDMQNEMVKVMALRVLRKIAGSLQSASFFTVMVDETTDVSNVEQVVVCLRWVSEKLEVVEEFVGLYEVASTGAETIYATITDVLLRLNFALFKGARPVLRWRC